MRAGVCHKGTARVAVRILAMVLAGAAGVLAQTSPDWRKIGGSGVDLMLASPATGPVDRVWYSADGSVLYAHTITGATYQTEDFEKWRPAVSPPEAPPMVRVPAVRLPEQGAVVVAASLNTARIWAMGRQLSRSDDGGRSWTNLTAYKSQSVVGPGQRSVAISPRDPDQITIAND